MSKEIFLVFTLVALVPANAYAYLDPGTGALILQAVVGAVAGAFMFCKLYWSKIKEFFSKNKSEDNK